MKPGDRGAEALARARLEAIAGKNPSLGAFVEIAADSALEQARASDERRQRGALLGELDGAPIAIKDNIDVAGMHAAAGLRVLRQRIAARDAACVAALRRQGAVFLGKTLMDEAAFGALGDNFWFGRCHNPARHGFTPGGSSGGSAAAVAAGMCLAALGTDTLGSVRIPASYCGVVGYVPSRGLIAMDGVQPLAPSFDRVGVLARSVSDAASVACAVVPSIRVDSAAKAVIGILDGLERVVPGNILTAVENAGQRLREGGRRLVRIDASGFDWGAVRRAALLAIEIEGTVSLAQWLDDPDAKISPAVKEALEFGRHADPERIERAAQCLGEARAYVSGWLERAQVIVLPATPQTAFAFDGEMPASQADFAAPSSILGLPAISVPAPVGTDELPVGVQLLAARGTDPLLLGVASGFA